LRLPNTPTMKFETVLSTREGPREAVKPPILRTEARFGHRPRDYGALMTPYWPM
jgi:hypothetical protein